MRSEDSYVRRTTLGIALVAILLIQGLSFGLLQQKIDAVKDAVASLDSRKLDNNRWPSGSYVILRNKGACPDGFSPIDAHLFALRMFGGSPENGPLQPNFLKEGVFGDSSISLNRNPGDYYGNLQLSACVKDK